eukprot:UN13779
MSYLIHTLCRLFLFRSGRPPQSIFRKLIGSNEIFYGHFVSGAIRMVAQECGYTLIHRVHLLDLFLISNINIFWYHR